MPLSGIVWRDVMGNDAILPASGGQTSLKLPAGQPFYLFTPDSASGTQWAAKLAPLNVE